MQPKITITIKIKVEGIHNFPDAEKLFPEVSYLIYPHRHTFDIECEFEVTHTNRDKEFICCKHEIESYLTSRYYDTRLNCNNFRAMSCEMIALELFEKFKLESCKVGEDNEFVATVTKGNFAKLDFDPGIRFKD